MSHMLRMIEKVNENNRKIAKLEFENRRLAEQEKETFLILQKSRLLPEENTLGIDYKGYNPDDDYIAGKFHVLLEGDLYRFDKERNLILISAKELITQNKKEITIS